MDKEHYAKFVENWHKNNGAMSRTGRKRFTIEDVRDFVRGACQLIADDIRGGLVTEEAKKK